MIDFGQSKRNVTTAYDDHFNDFIMQGRCVYTRENKYRAIKVKVDSGLGLADINNIDCNLDQKYADFSIRLPLSRRVDYTCYFEDILVAKSAVSPITILASHSEWQCISALPFESYVRLTYETV